MQVKKVVMMTQRLLMTSLKIPKRILLARGKQEARAATVSRKGRRQMMRRNQNRQSLKLQNQILKERKSAVGRGRREEERASKNFLNRRKAMEVTRRMRQKW